MSLDYRYTSFRALTDSIQGVRVNSTRRKRERREEYEEVALSPMDEIVLGVIEQSPQGLPSELMAKIFGQFGRIMRSGYVQESFLSKAQSVDPRIYEDSDWDNPRKIVIKMHGIHCKDDCGECHWKPEWRWSNLNSELLKDVDFYKAGILGGIEYGWIRGHRGSFSSAAILSSSSEGHLEEGREEKGDEQKA